MTSFRTRSEHHIFSDLETILQATVSGFHQHLPEHVSKKKHDTKAACLGIRSENIICSDFETTSRLNSSSSFCSFSYM